MRAFTQPLTRTEAEEYRVRSLGTGFNHTVALRAQMIKTTLASYRPDLILVDKKPCGVERELVPSLEASADLPHSTHWVLLLRDILDALTGRTRDVWHKHDYFEVIDHHYSQVLVVGSKAIFDMGEEYDFPGKVKLKMEYCGYIHKPFVGMEKALPRKAVKTVLVTPGGGQDGHRLIKTFLKGLQRKPLCDVHTIIVTGPEMEKAARKEIEAQAMALPTAVTVEAFTDDMQGLMSRADVVVSMGGYNTVCELVSMGKKAVIVPRKHPVQEQWIRAQRFARRGWLHCLDPDSLTPLQLIDAIDAQLNRGAARIVLPRSEWRGLEKVSDKIRGLVSVPSFTICQA